MSAQYAIKDLERLSGIKAHTLRIWEQRYGILKPERSDTNIRYYTVEDLRLILNISLLNHNGLKISKIAKLTKEEIVQQVQKIFNNYNKESDQVENLVLCLLEMNEIHFEKIIMNSIGSFGFENTLEKVILPFLRQIGNMWQVGIVNSAQEHFISNLIRQKLIAAIDLIQPKVNSKPKTFILFLPNKELHELSLLYSHYLIKASGHHCYYLGQSVPFEDLTSVAEIVKPDVLISVFTSPLENSTTQEYIHQLSNTFSGKSIIVSGRLFFNMNEKIQFPKNVILFENYKDFKNILAEY